MIGNAVIDMAEAMKSAKDRNPTPTGANSP